METLIKNVAIKSVAAALPKTKLELSSLKSIYGEKDVEKIIKVTGIKSVYVANDKQTSADICEASARILFKNGLSPDDVDGLIFVSQTRDHILPQTSHVLQGKLGLSVNTYCLDIPLGCSGYVHGIFQAALLVNSGACKRVLVLAGDTTSKLVNDNDRASRMVFGDAGTATLVEVSNTDMRFFIGSDGLEYKKLIIPAGGYRKPTNETTGIAKKAEDLNLRSEEDLFMDGMGIFNFAVKRVVPMLKKIVEPTKMDLKDVDLFVLHQANKFMVDYLRKRLKVNADKVPVEVKEYGNTGPSTIPLLLAKRGSGLKENTGLKKTILAGFGVGLSWASVLCDLDKTKFHEPIIIENE